MVEESQSREQKYREEIEAALTADSTRLGDVFRLRKNDANMSPQSIATELGIPTVSPVHAVLKSIDTLLSCSRLVSGTTSPSQKASMLRSFARRHLGSELSEQSANALRKLAEEHDEYASNEDTVSRESEGQRNRSESDPRLNVAGIYVYSYKHYLKYPVLPQPDDDSKDRTYLKIGKSEDSVANRIQGQTVTAFPEPPRVLRIFSKDGADLGDIETAIHNHLNAADHNRNKERGAGMEWFLTHLTLIDSTAGLMGLKVLYEHEEDE